MIKISQIQKSFKKKQVLNVDNIEIDALQSIGLVGNNGAGKTTLFRCILDLILPDAGDITINNENVQSGNWKSITGSYLDQDFLIPYLFPREYFYFVGKAYQLSENEIDIRLEKYHSFLTAEILESKKIIHTLSTGNKHKVGIVAAMMIEPQLLILDEPFANLDPSSQIKLKNLLIERKNAHNGITLVSSHDLDFVYEISDRILVLENGRLINDQLTINTSIEEVKSYFINQ